MSYDLLNLLALAISCLVILTSFFGTSVPANQKTTLLALIFAGFFCGSLLTVGTGFIFAGAFSGAMLLVLAFRGVRRLVIAELQAQLQNYEAMVKFAKERFAAITGAEPDQITRRDLYRAIDSGNFTGDELAVLKHMLRYIYDIGHSRYDRSMAISAGYPTMMPPYSHAISKADLESYESRLKERYRSWTGLN